MDWLCVVPSSKTAEGMQNSDVSGDREDEIYQPFGIKVPLLSLRSMLISLVFVRCEYSSLRGDPLRFKQYRLIICQLLTAEFTTVKYFQDGL
jgi:hypothetical protein